MEGECLLPVSQTLHEVTFLSLPHLGSTTYRHRQGIGVVQSVQNFDGEPREQKGEMDSLVDWWVEMIGRVYLFEIYEMKKFGRSSKVA